ncbi:MAG: hypothetical protein WC788_00330 [Candidatus Paceibacterota bacterium]|jgi:hypothetical protein
MTATTLRPDLETMLELLRRRATKADLEWFRRTSPRRYERYEELIGNKDDLADVINAETITLGIQYLVDAITRKTGSVYQYSDIPKNYLPRLASILGVPVPKKFRKKELIAKILENIGKN